MIVELLLGGIIGGHALKEIAHDKSVRAKLRQWSDEAGQKAKEYNTK